VAPDQIDLVGVVPQVGMQLHGQVPRLLVAGGVEAAFRQGMALVAEPNRVGPAQALRSTGGGHNRVNEGTYAL